MASKNDFKSFKTEALKTIRDLPKMMGKMALVEVSDNFRRQGHEDDAGAVVPWAPRKAQPRRGRGRAVRRRALLVQSGRLRRSPRIVATTATSVTIGTDVPYAQPLQEGTQHMRPRPFISVGKSFREKVIRQTASKIEKLLSR